MQNPLLEHNTLPNFDLLKPTHFEPAMNELMSSYKKVIDECIKIENPTWDNTIAVMEEESAKLSFAWMLIEYINGVQNTEEVRVAYETVLPLVTNFMSDLGLRQDLYQIYVKLQKSGAYDFYDIAQRTTIENAIRGFKLSGVDLPDEKKSEFKKINEKLSDLANQFEKNLIDATKAWTYHVTEDKKSLLDNLPEHAIARAKAKAEKEKKEGWILTLDFPCYYAVMSYAKDRNLRQSFHKAYITRASSMAESNEFDNEEIIDNTLKLKFQKSDLLGYSNYAEYCLVPKMAKKTSDVMGFLYDLVRRSKHQGELELKELKRFAKEVDNIEKLEVWDTTYYSTLYQKQNYNFSEEAIRPYFPEKVVFEGMFKLVERIFSIKIHEITDFTKWHETVRLFEIRDDKGELRGKFYTDLYTREHKRSGAWVSPLQTRMKCLNGEMQYPISFLSCNFTPASNDKPALLSHDEINTLFHEFGHTLQFLLTTIDYPSVSGFFGVPWDGVELPSQFMENWCWEWDVLQDISSHYETGEKLPKAEYEKLLSVKNYQSALQMLRQTMMSLFDMRIHIKANEDKDMSVQEILDDTRSKILLMQPPSYDRFQNSFGHIFAGGYDAGYYSYKWAEVLSSDAFSKFEEEGKFDAKIGKLFRETILEQGGSKDAMDIFVSFRGREPKIDALLRHNGIKT